jgi:hypothetical protein
MPSACGLIFSGGKTRLSSANHLFGQDSISPIASACCAQSNAEFAPDGRRFVLNPSDERAKASLDAQFVLDFFKQLRHRVPVR